MADLKRIQLFFDIVMLGETSIIPRNCIVVPGSFSLNTKALFYPSTKGITGYKILAFKSQQHAEAFIDLITNDEEKAIDIKDTNSYKFILNIIYGGTKVKEMLVNPANQNVVQFKKLILKDIIQYIDEFFKNQVSFAAGDTKKVPLLPYMKATMGVTSANDISPQVPSTIKNVVHTTPDSEPTLIEKVRSNSLLKSNSTYMEVSEKSYGLQSFYLINRLTLRALKDMGAVSGVVTETKTTGIRNYNEKLQTFVTLMKTSSPLWVKFDTVLKKLEEIYSINGNYTSNLNLSVEKYTFFFTKLKSLPNTLKGSGNEDKFLMTFASAFLAPYFDLLEERSQVLIAVNKMYVDFYKTFLSARGGIAFIDDPQGYFYKRMEKILRAFK